ncbi:BRO family protein [Corynebacterium sp. c7Ub_26]
MSIQLFNFRGDDVRIIVNESDEPEWVVTDVAKVLGYRDTSNMCRRLDEDEKGTRLEVSQ